MNRCGHTGQVLRINLSTGHIWTEVLSNEILEKFIGGMGVNIHLASKLISTKIDPFSPLNPIIIGTGPLVGTPTPASSRLVGTTKFPLSGAIACVCGSMSFAFWMKNAGYDHVVIEGKSEKPVYISIMDDNVEILPAVNIWGKNIYQTTDELINKHGRSGVIAIGRSGEKLVKFSLALIDKTSTFGRGGMGAVMGSKNLKAIVVRGNKGVKIAHEKEFVNLYENLMKRIKNYRLRDKIIKYGTLRSFPLPMLFGAMGEIKKAKQCTDRIYIKNLKNKRVACPSCPIPDKEILEIKEGEFKGLKNYSSSVINAFLLLVIDGIMTYNQAVKAFDTAQKHGLDALTMTSMVTSLAKMQSGGFLADHDTDGFEFKEDFDSFMKLAEIIVERKGIGDILADGWNEIMKSIQGSENHVDPYKRSRYCLRPSLQSRTNLDICPA